MENYKLKKLLKILKPYIKMDKKIIKFDDTEIEKYRFHQYDKPIDINKIVVSNKVPFCKNNFKYLIG